MRGSLLNRAAPGQYPRSIPARAGEPRQADLRRGIQVVYPRPCGGAPSEILLGSYVNGLSPPVRGSPFARTDSTSVQRSIPARAGEPRGNLAE